jgi:four helix bundle protein
MIKSEARNTKYETSSKPEIKKVQNSHYDLEDRTLQFAKDIRIYVKKLPKTVSTIEDSKQLIRSSGSVGANYREANDSLSKKDFVMRIKIARKEAKETIYWLELLAVEFSENVDLLITEATELMKILGAILRSTEK